MELMVSISALPNFLVGPWIEERMFTTVDGKYDIIFYNIREVRMLDYRCTFAVFDSGNPQKPRLAIGKYGNRTPFLFFEPFDYAPSSEVLITAHSAQAPDGRVEHPFLLLDLRAKKFSFLPWDHTSRYYGLRETEGGILSVYEKSSQQILAAKDHNRRAGERVDLKNLKWHSMRKLKHIGKLL